MNLYATHTSLVFGRGANAATKTWGSRLYGAPAELEHVCRRFRMIIGPGHYTADAAVRARALQASGMVERTKFGVIPAAKPIVPVRCL